MDKVRSEDGTPIAFERIGEGPPLIFVVGAFNDRATGVPLAEALKDRFAVFTYDRRGRGDSGDTHTLTVAEGRSLLGGRGSAGYRTRGRGWVRSGSRSSSLPCRCHCCCGSADVGAGDKG